MWLQVEGDSCQLMSGLRTGTSDARSVLNASIEREALLAAKVVLDELLAVVGERRRRVDLCMVGGRDR